MGETIGWIGVGSIGHRMARHLAKAGHTLVVADAGSTARAPEGSKIAKSNAEVAAGAETIILSLPDGKISVLVAKEIAAAPNRKARTVVDTSTIGIALACVPDPDARLANLLEQAIADTEFLVRGSAQQTADLVTA